MIQMQVKFQASEETFRRMTNMEKALAGKALTTALKRVGEPIAERASELAPDGDTGEQTNRKQTEAASKVFPVPLHKTITFAVRKTNSGGLVVIGANSKTGRFMNIDFGEKAFSQGRRHMLWSLHKRIPSAKVRVHNPEFRVQRNRFMERAVDEKIDAAIQAFEATLVAELDRIV